MNLAEAPDNDLLLRYCSGARDGDQASTVLYLRHAERLFWYFSRRGIRAADDAMHEVFYRALRDCEKLDPTKGTFLQWVYGIARNVLHELVREAASTRVVAPLTDDDDPPDLKPWVDDCRFIALDCALDSLSAEAWQGLHLHRDETGILRIGRGAPAKAAKAALLIAYAECYRELCEADNGA